MADSLTNSIRRTSLKNMASVKNMDRRNRSVYFTYIHLERFCNGSHLITIIMIIIVIIIIIIINIVIIIINIINSTKITVKSIAEADDDKIATPPPMNKKSSLKNFIGGMYEYIFMYMCVYICVYLFV
jgi:hypothetical protein